MSYDPNGEYWRARAEIAEAELAEHHKGFKETCDAMVRNAKERDEWKERAEITESHNDTLLRACDYYKAQVDRTREHWKSKALEMEDSRNEWQDRAQAAEALRDQALQWFNDATSGLMSVAAESNRYRLAWQSARRRAAQHEEIVLTLARFANVIGKRYDLDDVIGELSGDQEIGPGAVNA